MFYEDLEWCLKLSHYVASDPRVKPNLWHFIYFLLIIFSLIRVPVMTLVMFAHYEEPVTVKMFAEHSGNFTLFFHTGIYITTAFLKRTQILDLLQRIESEFWPMEDTEDIKKELKKARFLNRNVFFSFVLVLTTIFGLKPIIIGGDTLAHNYYSPAWLPRYVVLLVEDVTFVFIILLFGYFDVLLSTLLTLMKIQFMMLNKRLENICQNGDDRIDEEIQKCVDHHSFLLDFVDRFSLTFSKAIFIFIGNIILSLCICMYIILEEKSNPKVVVETIIHLMTGLNEIWICYSRPAQGFMNEANDVDRSTYFSNWYEYPKYARELLITMTRGQREIQITAGGIVTIDMNMFLVVKVWDIFYVDIRDTIGYGVHLNGINNYALFATREYSDIRRFLTDNNNNRLAKLWFPTVCSCGLSAILQNE